VKPGDALPDLRKEPVSKVQLVKYAGASGDYNLIHTDDETARRVGLDGVIAHGMLSMGFLGEYAAAIAGPRNVKRLKVRFAAMVRPGDVLTCRGTVKAVENGRATIELWAENEQGDKVTTGEAEVEIG
jgi:acyl dehydratase